MRLDQAIAARFPDVSRRHARELIATRRVLVNDRPVTIASRDVSERDRIVLADALPPIDVIASTDDWIAVNKPAGMPVQPTRDRKERSLEELLRVQFKTIYLVHRIDTPTSGIVLFARSQHAAAELSKVFAAREVRKTYLARFDPPLEREVVIETPIEGKGAKTIAHPNGEVIIETGRTHQIRIHLASIGHPVIGDRRYGGKSAPRLMLHAWKLEHERFGLLEATPPDDMNL